MPFLDFDIGRFREARPPYLHHKFVLVQKFKDFINWMLIYQGSSNPVRFRLCSEDIFDHEQVSRWIRIAARRNVQELEIICDPSEAFEFPYSLSVSHCLSVLRLNLSGRGLRLPTNVNFRQLKSLELECVNLTDRFVIQRLVSHCRVLEKLSLKDCVIYLQALNIASTSLKYLNISFYTGNDVDGVGFCGSKLEVMCPNLFSFSYSAPKPNIFSLGDLSSLEIMCLDLHMWPDYPNILHKVTGFEVLEILKEVVNIRSLCLETDSMALLVGEFDRLKCFNTTYQRLKSLTLSIGMDARYTRSMFLLLKNCPSLELLTLVLVELSEYNNFGNWQLDDEGSNWWRYNLKSIQLVDFVDEDNEISFVKFILKNGLILEKFDIIWMPGNTRSVATEKLILRAPKASSIVAVRFLKSTVDEWDTIF